MAANFAYKNTRDIKFILKEWLPLDKILEYPRFKEYYGIEDVDPILDTILKISKELIEPSADDGEKNPVRFENGQVIVPPSIPPLYKKLQSEGWGTSNIDETEGAMVLPALIQYPLWEMFAAANPALVPPFLAMTTGSAGLIQAFGDEHIKKIFLPKMMDGSWVGTMCLTEPTAGSDVGDILSRAYPTENPRIFKIKGQKIFISDGDNNFSENIVHLYLARVEGALAGTKGISLFVVPKFWVNEDGSLEPNDVAATGIEEKMGHHGNPTVSLSLGDNNSCRGWLLGRNPLENGGKGDGMAQMFQMMNEERMGTGLMCTALVANAFYNARDYARDRIQGRPLTNPKGDRIAIIEHEDIKRALLLGKSHVEAMRALVYKTFYDMDVKLWDPDPQARKKAADEMEVNTPLCKAYCSEEVWGLIAEALQIYGGYGYCEDYPVAKLARDSKINSIWEGANFIHSMDLIGRKWMLENGAIFSGWLQSIKEFYEVNKDTPGWQKEFAELGQAINSYGEIQKTVADFFAQQKLALVPSYSKRILMATAQMYAGSLLLDQALLADRKSKQLGPEHYDYKFYQGKIMAARYYLLNVVPHVNLVADLVKKADTSVLDIDIDSFDY